MAPIAQGKIDFPVRKTRASLKKGGENEDQKHEKGLAFKEEKEIHVQKTPTKRQKENDRTSACCSPPKRCKENFNEQRNSPRKLKNRIKFVLPSDDISDKSSAYKDAKQVLHTACPDRIIGREKEIKQLSSFLDDHLSRRKPGSLYVAGPPGTGKTACLSHLLKALTLKMKVKPVFINCMTLKKSQDIFKKIVAELGNKSCKPGKECLQYLEKTFSATGPMILLILDEIDHLDSKNQEVLYSIYEWSKLENSRLILIGVANALDLTDRVLPRLKACNITPKLLNYAPYTKDQIQAILQDRLQRVKSGDRNVFRPMAIQFCARKISACAGDIRKALDVCRRAIELVEADIKKPVLKSSNFQNSVSKEDVKFKQVDVPHIASVLKNVYDSRMTTTNRSFSETFPLQQKILIGTLLLILKKGKSKEVTIGRLHEVYCRVCKKQQISQISQSEFDSMCSMIDSRGIVAIKLHKERRLSRITMKIDENEVEHVLQDQSLVAAILDEETCLKR